MKLHTLARPTVLVAALASFAVVGTAPVIADGSSGDTIFVSVPWGGVIRSYDRLTMEQGTSYTGGTRPGPVALTPDGARLVSLDYSEIRLLVWDVATGSLLANPRLLGGDADLRDVVISPDGETAYITSGNGARIVIVDLEKYEEVDSYSFPFVGYYPDGQGIALTPDGQFVFAVDQRSRRLHKFDTYTHQFVGTGVEIPADSVEIAVCADGQHGIVVGDQAPVFFSTATGQVTSTGAHRGLQRDVSVVGDRAYVTNQYVAAPPEKSAAGPRTWPVEGSRAVDVYDLATGSLVDSYQLEGTADVEGVVAYDNTQVFVCMGVEGTGRIIRTDGTTGESNGLADTFGDPYRAAVLRSGGTSVVSFFLPTAVKMTLAGAGKDALVTSGLFDDGDLPVDFTEPVTLEVGDFTRTFQLEPIRGGKLYAYRSPEIQLTLTPNMRGSSRGKFKLKIQRTTLQGLVSADGPCELHFRATGLPDMAGTVVLEDCGYRRARRRGALTSPPFFAGLGQFTLKGEGQDSCIVRWGFSAGPTTPQTLGDVRVGIGALDLRIPGDAFVRSTKKGEELFAATLVEGATKITVTLDYKRELARVVAKNVELGALEAGMATDFVLDPGNGLGVMTNHVRLGGTSKRIFY